MSTPQVRLRLANAEDIPFIFNSWLQSYRSSPIARTVENPIYFSEHHKLAEKIIQNSTVLIACNNDDPSQIYGWICAGVVDNIFVLHYIYVKHSFRRMGVGRILFNAFPHNDVAGLYTHQTPIMKVMQIKFNIIYHPYILFNDYLKPLSKEVMNEQEE